MREQEEGIGGRTPEVVVDSPEGADNCDRYQLVVQACADAVFICDTHGTIIDCNRAAQEAFYASFSPSNKKHLVEAICPHQIQDAYYELVGAAFKEAEKLNGSVRREIMGCHAAGEELPLEMTVTPLRPLEPIQFAVYLRDVRQRKRSEQFATRQLQVLEKISSREPLADILDAVALTLEQQLPGALCGILSLDAENKLECLAAPNLPADYADMVRSTPVGPQGLPCRVAAYEKSTIVVYDIRTDEQFEAYREDLASRGLISCWSTPMLTPEGQVLGTFAVYYRQPHDPSQEERETVAAISHLACLAIGHQQAETAVRDSESRFRSVLENSQDANYRCNLLQGIIDYISPAIETITGYTTGEFIALGVGGLMESIHPHDRPHVDHVVEEVNRGRLPFGNVEYRVRRKDGSYRWINDRFTTVRDEDGTPLYWVGSLQEIHTRKIIEETLQATNFRYSQQHKALTQLTRSQILQTMDLQVALREIAETVAALVAVERVSIWRFTADRRAIECYEMYEHSLRNHSSGMLLTQYECPSYFRAMADTDVISADNAWTDLRTAELAATFLRPAGVTSLLAAPLQLAGEVEGVVCLEHVGPARQWQYDEQSFVVSIANLVSLSLAQWELSHAEEAVRVSEANLANAQRIARLGSWTWNIQTGEQKWSDEVYQLLGVDPDEVSPGHHVWTTRVHPDDLAKVKVLINKTLNECTRYDCEYRVVHPDETQLVLQEQAEVTCSENGKALMLTGTILDITARKRAEEKLVHDAMHDALTGLANRKLISDHAGIAFHLFQRHAERRFALIMADLDRFKNVNDTLGHQMGDKVLQETALRISEAVRAGDTVARLGGDEFAVLLEDISDEETPTRVAQRILESMVDPIVIGDTVIDVGVSLGVVVITPGHSSTEEVFRDADIALYRAKDAGRGAYQVFDQEMHRRILDRLNLESDLRHAIERNQLLLFLQPIVSLDSGEIVAFEALLRWKHPEKGLISPALFIPIAEETKQIIQIGNWVAWRACEILRDWPGGAPPPISINVSPVQLLNSANSTTVENRKHARHWDQDIAVIAGASGIAPSLLGIEVTEGVFIGDPVHTSKLLDMVVSKGFKLLLDDFGTGYSSLSYLQDLPFYRVKLDGAFTAKLKAGTRSHELMRGIIGLAHSIGLEVVAEGVETQEQLELLRSAGCDHAQGYLFSPPLPVNEAQSLYRSGRKW